MSFIGESRRTKTSPWKDYVCLDVDECKMLLGSVRRLCKRKEEAAARLIDIRDGGYATERQTTEMDKAVERMDKSNGILAVMEEFIRIAELRRINHE